MSDELHSSTNRRVFMVTEPDQRLQTAPILMWIRAEAGAAGAAPPCGPSKPTAGCHPLGRVRSNKRLVPIHDRVEI
jgi:hypothetical protein